MSMNAIVVASIGSTLRLPFAVGAYAFDVVAVGLKNLSCDIFDRGSED